MQEIMQDEAENVLKESLDKQQNDEEEVGQKTVTDKELKDVLDGDDEDTEQPNSDENELFPNTKAKEVSFHF